jgi:hypothetical protein
LRPAFVEFSGTSWPVVEVFGNSQPVLVEIFGLRPGLEDCWRSRLKENLVVMSLMRRIFWDFLPGCWSWLACTP